MTHEKLTKFAKDFFKNYKGDFRKEVLHKYQDNDGETFKNLQDVNLHYPVDFMQKITGDKYEDLLEESGNKEDLSFYLRLEFANLYRCSLSRY
ncbi:MAG: hypothetical protein ACYDEG_06530 [bacterium]